MAGHFDDHGEPLDSAMDDFQNVNLDPTRSEDKSDNKEDISSLPTKVLGLGLGLPDLKAKKKGKQKGYEESRVSETRGLLKKPTREAAKGLESTSTGAKAGGEGVAGDLNKDSWEDDWYKQFEELAGTQNTRAIVESVMEELLGKKILHNITKQFEERYLKWLEDHKAGLIEEDYKRYSHQYELIQELNGIYETEPGNFAKIVVLLQKMQECGWPPYDIMQELVPDFDPSAVGPL
ncbi:hypothetical protein Nepgr_028489 [Nepenthes gracilis]|uniref:Uncharacterized protein n=1 Tax=Nepenthes gracilis TaxID=150966 RepID=A0AAD3TD56_NEPGR|nr:hypothetical protein Nepgr_028489 [Nepenthes gracilis]